MARELFDLSLDFNRGLIFDLVTIIKKRSSIAGLVGFKNYFEYKLMLSTSVKYSHKTPDASVEKINTFVEDLQELMKDRTKDSLTFIKERLGKDQIHLSDIFHMRNSYIEMENHILEKQFNLSEILKYISHLTSKFFDLEIEYEFVSLDCIENKVILLKVNNPVKNLKSYIILDLF